MRKIQSISVIIPCYNPAEDWVENVQKNFEQFQQSVGVQDIFLIVVNDGAKNNTDITFQQKLKDLIPNATFINYEQNRGKGFALRTGVRDVATDIYIVTDIDFPYTNQSMLSIVEALSNETTNVAVGFRDTAYYAKVPLSRKWLSIAFRWVVRNVLSIQAQDTQCGLKGFDNHGKKLFLATTIDRFLYDLEFLVLSSRNADIHIESVPVELKDGIVFSSVGMKVILAELSNFLKIVIGKN